MNIGTVVFVTKSRQPNQELWSELYRCKRKAKGEIGCRQMWVQKQWQCRKISCQWRNSTAVVASTMNAPRCGFRLSE